MKLKDLIITDDLALQISFGKALAESYEDDMIVQVRATLDKFADYNKLGIERDDLFYKSIYDYWVYGFTPDQQVLFQLVGKSHEEKSKFISFKIKYKYFDRLNKRSDMHILENKYEAYQLLKPYFKREMIKIESVDDYECFLDFTYRHSRFISKPLGLSCGMGVRIVDMEKIQDKKQLFFEILNAGHEYDGDYLYNKSDHTRAVLEELIVQDEALAYLHPWSVNGVRITTVRVEDKITPIYPWVKIGAFHHSVATPFADGFDAGIDVRTGILVTNGMTDYGTQYEQHPTTGVTIQGYQIPRWQEAIDLAIELAKRCPKTINYVGWDLVLTKEGWVLMEGNFHGDVMWQMIWQKGTRKEFEELIGWHYDKPFWWSK